MTAKIRSYRFKALLQTSGWMENACVSVDESGKIVSVSQEEKTDSVRIDGYALPGFQNAHSHAFQYAMAGLAERHRGGNAADDFWSWREAMYNLALNLNPEQVRKIAAMLYAELLRNGYTSVAEFHYLHHDETGRPYGNEAEMGEALIAAASDAGIKITLVPIFYQKGGFGRDPEPRQRRFISPRFEDYARLFEASARACENYENANVAVGIHSLRGVEAEDVVRTARELPTDLPFHIHVAEQLKEVEDCLNFLGKRPVQWLLANLELNERFHLVHATHLTPEETERLAKTGASVVLCPSTEGNLGDGIFPLRAYQSSGGVWSIGTDSHVGLCPLEELRLLDYGQRLVTHRRDTFTDENGSDGGAVAIAKATVGGRRAMNNFEKEFFASGADFDACIIDPNAPLLADVNPENLASAIVYTAGAAQISGTFVKGKFVQNDERYERIKKEFLDCVKNFRR